MTLRIQKLFPALLIAMLIISACAGQPTSQPTVAQPTAGAVPTSVPESTSTTPVVPTTSVMPTTPAAEGEATPVMPATGAETTPLPENTPEQGSASGVRFEIVPEKSEARYRVREQLVNLSLPNDAIGRTNGVSGAIVLNPDGTIDSSASQFTVDVSTLKSDSDRRDSFVHRNTLQTGQYPTVTFVPREIRGVTWPLPEAGDFSFQLVGDLTIRDVTREVTWDMSGTLDGDQAVGQAKTVFKFADFNLQQPSVPVVLSIVDQITLELDATMLRTGGAAGVPAAGAPAAAPTAAAAAVPKCSAPAALTPAMTEGPYYTPNAPERTSLLEPGVPGEKLLLTGYVLDANCQPIPGAVVDFWQTDGLGNYDNSGYRLRGQQKTDSAGRYTLETVIPGLYPGRTAHIHVKVRPPSGAELTSQLFFPGEAQNQTDSIFDPALLVEIQPGADGTQQGRFDFVVQNGG